MSKYEIGLIVIAAIVGAVMGHTYQTTGTAQIKGGEWYCSDARVDSLDLPLTVQCYEYKRKGAHDDTK